jgi:hypothetical protein
LATLHCLVPQLPRDIACSAPMIYLPPKFSKLFLLAVSGGLNSQFHVPEYLAKISLFSLPCQGDENLAKCRFLRLATLTKVN